MEIKKELEEKSKYERTKKWKYWQSGNGKKINEIILQVKETLTEIEKMKESHAIYGGKNQANKNINL